MNIAQGGQYIVHGNERLLWGESIPSGYTDSRAEDCPFNSSKGVRCSDRMLSGTMAVIFQNQSRLWERNADSFQGKSFLGLFEQVGFDRNCR